MHTNYPCEKLCFKQAAVNWRDGAQTRVHACCSLPGSLACNCCLHGYSHHQGKETVEDLKSG